jgi:hypothetical protein
MTPYNSGAIIVITSALIAPPVYAAKSCEQVPPPSMTAGHESDLIVQADVTCGIETPEDIADHHAMLAVTMADIDEVPQGAFDRSVGTLWHCPNLKGGRPTLGTFRGLPSCRGDSPGAGGLAQAERSQA